MILLKLQLQQLNQLKELQEQRFTLELKLENLDQKQVRNVEESLPLIKTKEFSTTKELSTNIFEGNYLGSQVIIKKHILPPQFDFIKVVQPLARIRHPRCVAVFGYALDPTTIVTEYPERGTLDNLLKGFQIKMEFKLQIATDIMDGLEYLHSITLIHKNIQPSNIYITNTLRAKLSEPNILYIKQTDSWRYSAPEIERNLEYSTFSDKYALAITLWELFEEKTPFTNVNPELIHKNDLRPSFAVGENSVPTRIQSYLKALWALDLQTRESYSLDTIKKTISSIRS